MRKNIPEQINWVPLLKSYGLHQTLNQLSGLATNHQYNKQHRLLLGDLHNHTESWLQELNQEFKTRGINEKRLNGALEKFKTHFERIVEVKKEQLDIKAKNPLDEIKKNFFKQCQEIVDNDFKQPLPSELNEHETVQKTESDQIRQVKAIASVAEKITQIFEPILRSEDLTPDALEKITKLRDNVRDEFKIFNEQSHNANPSENLLEKLEKLEKSVQSHFQKTIQSPEISTHKNALTRLMNWVMKSIFSKPESNLKKTRRQETVDELQTTLRNELNNLRHDIERPEPERSVDAQQDQSSKLK